ncbi:MAG: alpha/beta hydrolase [Desulfobacteraceae bacterium]|nr:alpha/beta hydrolase [Desulfobacteraceae bacterium]
MGAETDFQYHFFSPQKNLRLRYGVMTVHPKPATGVFLLLHGRAEFIEKYKAVANQLTAKGFNVVTLDWRGQGLSTREVGNRHKGYIHSFNDYVADLTALYDEVMEPLGLPVHILAHSMGGHIALRFMAQFPHQIKKAVLASPMVDIALPGLVYPLSKHLSKHLSKRHFAKTFTPGLNNYSPESARFQGNKLCHDPEQFRILHDEIRKNPDLAIGGVTWGWLKAAFESIEILKNERFLQKIKTPVLILGAQKDRVVSLPAQEKLSRKLVHGDFHCIEGAFHELMFETPRIREKFWSLFDLFMREDSKGF